MLSPVEKEIIVALLRVHGPAMLLHEIAQYMDDTLRAPPEAVDLENVPVERVATIQQRLALREAQMPSKGRGRNQSITPTVLGQVKRLREAGQTMPQVASATGFSQSGIYHALQEERQKKR